MSLDKRFDALVEAVELMNERLYNIEEDFSKLKKDTALHHKYIDFLFERTEQIHNDIKDIRRSQGQIMKKLSKNTKI